MNFYYYSKYNGKSTIEQLRRVTFLFPPRHFILSILKYAFTGLPPINYIITYRNSCFEYGNTISKGPRINLGPLP